jgi:hypothetical protein
MGCLLLSVSTGVLGQPPQLTETLCAQYKKDGLSLAELKGRYGPPSFTGKDITLQTYDNLRCAFLPSGPEKGTNYYYVTPDKVFQFVTLANGKVAYRGFGQRFEAKKYAELKALRK